MKTFESIVYVAQHLFFVRDPSVEFDGSFTNDPWSGDNLGTAPGTIGVQSPKGGGNAPVFVQVLDALWTNEAPARFEKVAEGSIECPSGTLVIEGEQNDVSASPLEIQLEPGTWRARVLFADLDSATYDDEDGAEHYVIQLARGEAVEARVTRANEPVDDPIRAYNGEQSADELEAIARGADASAACSALVALARMGESERVVALAEGARDVLRLTAVNALWLAKKSEAIEPFAEDAHKAVAHAAKTALDALG